jgi:hypothetical protein
MRDFHWPSLKFHSGGFLQVQDYHYPESVKIVPSQHRLDGGFENVIVALTLGYEMVQG